MHSPSQTKSRSTRSKALGLGFLCVWTPLVLVGVSSLMVGHFAPLPAPVVHQDTASDALSRARRADAPLLAMHVLDAECRCSGRVAEHLLQSERPSGCTEVVVLVGDDPSTARALERAGFVVEHESPASAEQRFGPFAAPALAVLETNSGALRYLGGYTDRKQGLAVRDLELIHACAQGLSPMPLPVLGCGATADLERSLDPLGLLR